MAERTCDNSIPPVTALFIASTVVFKAFSDAIAPPDALLTFAITSSILFWIESGVSFNVSTNLSTPPDASFVPAASVFEPFTSPWDFFVSSKAAFALFNPDEICEEPDFASAMPFFKPFAPVSSVPVADLMLLVPAYNLSAPLFADRQVKLC